MPSLPKFSLLGALVAVIALLALPAAAEATLVYVKNPMQPGRLRRQRQRRRRLQGRAGTNPRVSPDGDVIAYSREGSSGKRALMLAAAAGRRLADGPARTSRTASTSPSRPTRSWSRRSAAPRSARASWSCSTSPAAPCCARSPAATSAASASPRTAPNSPTRGPERRLPDQDQRLHRHGRRRQAGPDDQGRQLGRPALGAEREDRLRQAARRQAAASTGRRTSSS